MLFILVLVNNGIICIFFQVRFHPSSVLRDAADHTNTLQDLSSDWVLYEEMGKMGRMCHVRTCTVVSPVTVFLMAGPSRMAYDPQFDGEADGKSLTCNSDKQIYITVLCRCSMPAGC